MATTEEGPRTSVFAPLTVVLSTAWVLITVVLGAVQAVHAYGRPFPGLLVDPYGTVSGVALPAWRAARASLEPSVLRYPDQIVAVEGRALADPTKRAFPTPDLRERLAELAARGRVQVTVRRAEREHQATLPILHIGVGEIALLFVSYTLVGLLLSWSGTTVLLVSQRRQGSLAYAAVCWGSLAFLATLFDYHTTAALVPLFHLGRLGTALACVWLAYAFPSPPRRRRWPRIGLLAASLCALAILSALLAPDLPLATRRSALIAADLFFFAGMLVLPAAILARSCSSKGRSRAELNSSAAGVVVAPILISVGLLPGGGLFYVALPYIIAALPLSIGYALIHHNILAATLELGLRHFIAPALIVGTLFALMAFGLLRDFLWPNGDPPRAAAGALILLLSLGFAGTALAIGRRAFFGTTLGFRPTIEQLSGEFSVLRDRTAIQRSVERTVTRWLSTPGVSVVEVSELDAMILPAKARARLRAGEKLWTLHDALTRRLIVPIRFLGELRGGIVVPPKRHGALFTADELELLETVSKLAAIALDHARALEELETFRKLELDLSRRDKGLALAVLGAEVAHEVAYPLNFFRYLLRRYDHGERLGSADLEVARDEISRLERMLVRLRRFGTEPPRRTLVELEPPLMRALDLVRELVREKRLEVRVDIPSGLSVLADPDPLLQVFANLIRNAAQASETGGAIEVRAFAGSRGTVIEVSDSGPGVPAELQQSLFSPWVSGRAGGLGLGLAITHRIVRNFGWDIRTSREGGWTRFRVLAAESPARAEA